MVQYYEGLRVVYELESRVHDLQGATDNDATSGSQQPAAPQPDTADSFRRSDKDGKKPAAQPQQKQRSGGPGGSGAGDRTSLASRLLTRVPSSEARA